MLILIQRKREKEKKRDCTVCRVTPRASKPHPQCLLILQTSLDLLHLSLLSIFGGFFLLLIENRRNTNLPCFVPTATCATLLFSPSSPSFPSLYPTTSVHACNPGLNRPVVPIQLKSGEALPSGEGKYVEVGSFNLPFVWTNACNKVSWKALGFLKGDSTAILSLG